MLCGNADRNGIRAGCAGFCSTTGLTSVPRIVANSIALATSAIAP
jgi:hypothetical protein